MTYPATQTFWLERTGQARIGLRRYARSQGSGGWSCEVGWHAAQVWVGQEGAVMENGRLAQPPTTPHGDPRWPRVCDKGCGYVFDIEDPWQEQRELMYARLDGQGEPVVLRDAPPGAMWDAKMAPAWTGPDGITLVVRLPNHQDWIVDKTAHNCTEPGRKHFCWVRHGDPRRGTITVDKDGDTCSAGAGSIAVDRYHGFLQHGWLTAG